MAETLYAAFDEIAMAEKAAGALLDHGVRPEDLSLVQHESWKDLPRTVDEHVHDPGSKERRPPAPEAANAFVRLAAGHREPEPARPPVEVAHGPEAQVLAGPDDPLEREPPEHEPQTMSDVPG